VQRLNHGLDEPEYFAIGSKPASLMSLTATASGIIVFKAATTREHAVHRDPFWTLLN
jgi:hypothetical protein